LTEDSLLGCSTDLQLHRHSKQQQQQQQQQQQNDQLNFGSMVTKIDVQMSTHSVVNVHEYVGGQLNIMHQQEP